MNKNHGYFRLALAGIFGLVCIAAAAEVGVLDRSGIRASEIPADRVAPALLQKLQRGGLGDFVVEFAEKADLSAAFGMPWHERGRFVHRTLHEVAARSQSMLRATLQADGVEVQSYWIKNAMLVRGGDLAALHTAARFAGVVRISEPPRVAPIEPEPAGAAGRTGITDNLTWVGADQVWARGTTGSGVTVGVIDSGVRYTHEAIVGQYRGNLGGGAFDHDYNWRGPFAEPTTPDQSAHATHVLGTIVGDNRAADPAARERTGIAPGAQWMACHGLQSDVFDPDLVLLECGQFMLAPTRSDGSDPDPDLRAHVVNNSWGEINCDGTATGFYADMVEAWVAAGMFPVFAAGNASNCNLPEPPGLSTVTSPASLGTVFTIGSTGNHDGQYAPHSLWGPTTDAAPEAPGYPDPNGYPHLKPQVVAPGVAIRSAVIEDDQSYAAFTGTSMSAPQVAGLVALMLDAAECLAGDYATLAEIIMQTARPLPYDSGGQPPPGPGNVPNYATGWGEIDALAAVNAASALCGPSGSLRGTVTDKTGVAIARARVEIFIDESERVYETLTEPDGRFVRRLPVDAGEGYTVRVSAYGYLPASEAGALIFEDQMTAVDLVLPAAPVHHISGRISDALTGWPLHARIIISGAPQGSLWSDPVTGAWAVDLPEGTTFRFDVHSEIAGYLPQALTLESITGGMALDFELQADADTCTAPGYDFTDTVFFEDFSTASGATPPAGWQVSSEGLGWQFGDADDLSSLNFTIPEHGQFAAANDELGSDAGMGNDGRFDYLTMPSQNLTGLDQPVLTYRSYHNYEPGPFGGPQRPPAKVEASTDGGATWVVLGIPRTTNFGKGWTDEAVGLVSAVAADVLIRFHADDLGDGGPFGTLGAGWAIDDVAIRTGCAAPAQGGLVLGQVRDANTAAALDAAAVRVDGGPPVQAGSNEHLGPGFFALYADSNASLLQAAPGAALPAGYGEGEAPLLVADGQVVRQDALLPAGRLRIYPESPSATLDLGTTATASFTVANTGTAPLNFGFEGEAVEEHFEEAFPPTGWTLETTGTDCTWQWLDPATHPNLAGGDGRAAMVNPIDCIDASGIDTALITHELDLSGTSTASIGFFLAFHEPGIGATRLDIDVSTDGGANWDTVFTETEANSPAGPGTLVEFDLTPFAGSAALQVRFRFRSDTNWSRVIIDQVHLFTTINDTGTLTLSPDAGSLQPGESVEIQTLFDATMIAQPGTYRVPVRVAEDTPYPFPYGDFAATMTVTAPASYGAVGGQVRGLGKCDAGASALIGVEVWIADANSTLYTASTDEFGSYQYWLEAAQGPFTVIVDTEGYAPVSYELELEPGETLPLDIDLRLQAACLETQPAAINATVDAGEVENALVELLNTGPAATGWQIRPGGDPRVLTPSTISQTNSSELEKFISFACINPATGFVTENRYLRVFPMSEYSSGEVLDIQGITFGVDNAESASGSQPVHIRLYALEGDFVLANLTLLAEATVEVADTVLEHISTAFDSPVSAAPDALLVAEIHVPDGIEAGHSFYPGGNTQGATAPSWSVAPACGWEEPTPYEALNLAWMQLVLELDVLVSDPCGAAAAPVPWLSFAPGTGSLAGDSSAPITAAFDAGGQTLGNHAGSACLAEDSPGAEWTVIPAWMYVGGDGGDMIFSDRFE